MQEGDKRRILFINGHLKTGGIEKSLIDILKNLDYGKYNVDLLLLENVGEYADQLPHEVNIHFHPLANTYGSVLLSLVRCVFKRDWFCLKMRLIFLAMKFFGQKQIKLSKRLLTQNVHYDCVIGFRSGICMQVAAYAVSADKRITWWHHGNVEIDSAFIELALRFDKLAVVSEGCKQALENKAPVLKEKLVVVSNMIDTNEISRLSKMENIMMPTSKIYLLSLGRIAPEKHFENVVYAAEYLLRIGIQDFEWHVIGGDWDFEKIQSLVKLHNMGSYVIMDGIKSNPYPYLKNADLYVHPSYVESQGLSVLEAMSLGVPCVVTKSLGPSEFIRDGENGLLVEQGWEPLARGVERMLTDRALYEKIRANTRCPEEFSPTRVMEKIEGVL